MKTIKTKFLGIILLFIAVNTSYAQTTTTPSHGGIVQKSGDYTIELVKIQNQLIFYIQDINKKAVSNKGVTGNVAFQFSDNTATTTELSPLGEDGLLVINEKEGMVPSLTISAKVQGKTLIATFKNVPGATKGHGHTHGPGGHTH